MSLEVLYDYRESKSVREMCKSYLFYHAVIQLSDGNTFDGIIEGIDGDNVIILVGEDVVPAPDEKNMNRQPPGRRFRRFRRRNFPIGGIGGIGLVPYPIVAPPIFPPIYPYPPVPFPYPY